MSQGELDDKSVPPPAPQPAPVPLLHLFSLPDIAHDAVASYLINIDIYCMMESSPWLVKTYGERVETMRLDPFEGAHDDPSLQVASSLMSHRCGLTRLALHMDETMDVVLEATREGHLHNLQVVEVIRC